MNRKQLIKLNYKTWQVKLGGKAGGERRREEGQGGKKGEKKEMGKTQKDDR